MINLNYIEIPILIIFIVLITLALIQFINPVYDESKKIHYTTRILNFLWILGAIFLLYVFFLIFGAVPEFLEINNDNSDNKILLSSIGIAISAFIASASLMKSIANTNRIEEQKTKRELFDRRKEVILTSDELSEKLGFANVEYLLADKELIEISRKVFSEAQFIFKEEDSLLIRKVILTIDEWLRIEKEKEGSNNFFLQYKDLFNNRYKELKINAIDSNEEKDPILYEIIEKYNKKINIQIEIFNIIFNKIQHLKDELYLI